MASRLVWIEDMHNLHCPSCDEVLRQDAGVYHAMGRAPDNPAVHVDRRLRCPNGHPLPAVDDLVAYRDRKGYPPTRPLREL